MITDKNADMQVFEVTEVSVESRGPTPGDPAWEAMARDAFAKRNTLKASGGSDYDAFNLMIAVQVSGVMPRTADMTELSKIESAAAAQVSVLGIDPKDELEGMLAAQLVASHQATMECFRRAMLESQSFEGRRENLNQANKLSRTYATLLEALNRHRGKGQQKVTVEHVHVYAGGQAIVGAVEGGGRVPVIGSKQPHAQLGYASQSAMWSPNTVRFGVSVASDGER